MFDRLWAKTMAKNRLRAGRGNAILVMLILTLLGAVSSGIDFSFNFHSDTGADVTYSTYVDELSPEGLTEWLLRPDVIAAILAMTLVGLVVGMCVVIFFTNVLATGGRGWYLRYVRGASPDVGELFASFRIYKPVMCTTGLRTLYVFLWSLLFVIPGIIKSYAYSMADYIIYENPNLSASQALRLSEKLTDGAKGDLFVFDLSFLGWRILDTFTAGILGVVHVNPYVYGAHAAVYDALKWRAINEGVLTWEDFGQVPPPPAPPQPEPTYAAPQPGASYAPPQYAPQYTPQPGYYAPPQYTPYPVAPPVAPPPAAPNPYQAAPPVAPPQPPVVYPSVDAVTQEPPTETN